MKRQVQYPGVRKWSGDDLLSLQSEPLSVADKFFSQFGNCIICGCELTDGKLSAGLVSIGGMTVPFPGASVEVFPVYLVTAEKHVQREYADDVVRDIAVEYSAKVVTAEPEGECIVITEEGTASFFDMIEASWLDTILERLQVLADNDDTIADAIIELETKRVSSDNRITALEKKMPSFLDHTPTVTDDGYAIGVEVWTVAEDGQKTFWKCHDNAKGAAVWHKSGQGGGGGSHSGAVYLTGQTNIAKASILIKGGYLE